MRRNPDLAASRYCGEQKQLYGIGARIAAWPEAIPGWILRKIKPLWCCSFDIDEAQKLQRSIGDVWSGEDLGEKGRQPVAAHTKGEISVEDRKNIFFLYSLCSI
jgi:hypothetical protein